MTHTITPFLMFDGRAREAIDFYTSLFPDASVTDLEHYRPGEDGPEGKVKHAVVTLAGQRFMVIDSPVKHDFTFTPAISLYVACETAAEFDQLFSKLGEGGLVFMPADRYPFAERFGWLADRFGVSWQIGLTN